jgi:5-methylcytosine-specific restriction endonuclease McrA
MDHVLAASRGGKWEWENLVTACSSCNVKKGNKTLEEARMKLMKSPRVRSFVICDL